MWVSVNERLPGPDEEVPFVFTFGGTRIVTFGKRPEFENYAGWRDTTCCDIDGYPTDRFEVTHWFELPPAPSV